MSINRLINIGGLKHSGDSNKDISNLSKQVEKEFDHLRVGINKAIKTLSSPTVTPVAIAGSADSAFTSLLSKAGISAITAVADVFIPFVGDPLTSYVLSAYFLDSSGQFANLPVPQAKWASTGFTVTSDLIPSAGMLFYLAIPIN